MTRLYPGRAPGGKTEKPAGKEKLEPETAAMRAGPGRYVEAVRWHARIPNRWRCACNLRQQAWPGQGGSVGAAVDGGRPGTRRLYGPWLYCTLCSPKGQGSGRFRAADRQTGFLRVRARGLSRQARCAP